MIYIEDIIDVFIQLAFELGQLHQYIYDKAGLDNIIDFNDIAFAKECGAELECKGNMEDLTQLFKVHKLDENKIKELNKIANKLQKVKKIAKQQLIQKR